MGNAQAIPVIREVVTVFEAVGKTIAAGACAAVGQTKAANKLIQGVGQTFVNYSEVGAIVANVHMAVMAGCGDDEKVRRLRDRQEEAWLDLVENTPMVGHGIGIGRYIAGDTEGGNRCMIGSSRSTVVLAATVATGGAGELQGCFLLQMVKGLEYHKYLKFFRWNTCRNSVVVIDFPQTLEVVEIYGSKESKVFDIGSLGGCIRLLELTLSYHPMLAIVSNLCKLHKLEKVDFSGCCKVEEVQGLGGLRSLKHLILENCKRLRHCNGLETLDKLQTLNLRGCVIVQLPTVWGLRRLVNLHSINIGGILVVQRLGTWLF
jgi:hypothetical protein